MKQHKKVTVDAKAEIDEPVVSEQTLGEDIRDMESMETEASHNRRHFVMMKNKQTHPEDAIRKLRLD
ncbi:unnamed protein product [Sphenostylis stenocarpa]|uniref:Uncharacterized protein n=1 Tax=Sphenostylis stenocarpa TaxID=92480 RepID=A0AA86SW96_9FABA|nr:unnamed protein product [Sphenostylis stenocarpa]